MNNIRKFCVAPMMGYTTPHARKLYRILSKKAFLFSEMIPAKTMIHSKNKDFIIDNNNSNPVALQVGGSDLKDLAMCSKIAETYNYDEINLNVGCPSKAVQKGSFGACLMKDKHLVRNCLESMANSTNIKVSIKCRIGLGKEFDYEFFYNFINEIAKSGIDTIYVHARNAILSNFSPSKNRTIPPLNYDFVKKIKNEFPKIQFIINGGINSIEEAKLLLKDYDGVMIGRLIQNNPFCLLRVDKEIYNLKKQNIFYQKIISNYFDYIKIHNEKDSIFRLLSPLLKIFFNVPNSKKFKSDIQSKMQNNNLDVLEKIFLNFVANEKLISN